jgi:hypothetical protein
MELKSHHHSQKICHWNPPIYPRSISFYLTIYVVAWMTGIEVRFPAGAGEFSLLHSIQNGSGAHPVSYTITYWRPFPWE